MQSIIDHGPRNQGLSMHITNTEKETSMLKWQSPSSTGQSKPSYHGTSEEWYTGEWERPSSLEQTITNLHILTTAHENNTREASSGEKKLKILNLTYH